MIMGFGIQNAGSLERVANDLGNYNIDLVGI
jgi:hypothetical protein